MPLCRPCGLLLRCGGFERLPGGRKDLFGRDVAHAAMVDEPANRLVARPARQVGGGFDGGGQRIERSPVPGAGRPEYADRRRAGRRRDVNQTGIVRHRHGGPGQRQNGVAQIGAGQIAGCGIADDFGG